MNKLMIAIVLAVLVGVTYWIDGSVEDVIDVIDMELYNALLDEAPAGTSEECLTLAVETMKGKWYKTDADTATCARNLVAKLAKGR